MAERRAAEPSAGAVMNLTALALRRPVTVVMAIVGLALIGIVSYLNLPVRQYPNVSFPVVQVRLLYPGADPTDVLNQVGIPVENALATIPGLSTMTATALTGQERITLQLVTGTNVSAAAADATAAVQQIQSTLPAGVSMPEIIQANPLALPIMELGVTGSSSGAAAQWTANTLVPRVEELPGVGFVDVTGSPSPQVSVGVHPAMLESLGLTLAQVDQAIAANNATGPAGALIQGGTSYQIRSLGRYASLAALANTPVALKDPSGNGQAPLPVPLSAVASITNGIAPPTSITEINGTPAVGVSVTQQSSANSLAVANEITRLLHTVSPPPGLHVAVVTDATRYTRAALTSVQEDLLLAILFAGLILQAFLHRVKHTAIIMLAIPTSLLATFAVMAILGFSLDLISLMALSLLIGILVDDSIVVLENIHRHRVMGKSSNDAAYAGRMEIGAAAVAITLTDVVVYGPMAIVPGNVGQIFREFGLTIVAATLFSLLISFTLTPMLASRWMTEGGDAPTPFSRSWNRTFERLRTLYGRVLGWALANRGWTVALAGVTLAGAVALIPLGIVGTAFIPAEDTGLFTINVTLPPGTPVARTSQVLTGLAQSVRGLAGVTSTFQVAGLIGQANVGRIDVSLAGRSGRPSIFVVEAETQAIASRIPDLAVSLATANPLLPGDQPPVSVSIAGPAETRVDALATALSQRLARLPQLQNVSNAAPVGLPQIGFTVNRAEAAASSVTTEAIDGTLAGSVAGTMVSQYRPVGAVQPLPVVVAMSAPVTLARLGTMSVPATGGGSVPLSALGQFGYGTAPTVIQQTNRQYAATVTADVSGTTAIGRADQAVHRVLAAMPLPAGYQIIKGGQSQQKAEAFGPLFEALLLSVLLVYMLMAALYESLRLPLSVMTAVPFAGAGALMALGLTGQTLNIFSIIGLIMLMGLVTKNAILIVDYTETLRKRGLSRRDALIEAGQTRLRPILMTTATMVFAMLPLALALGAGSAERSSMAVVVIGGLVVSTALTLLVVPVLYTVFDGDRRQSRSAEFTAARGPSVGA